MTSSLGLSAAESVTYILIGDLMIDITALTSGPVNYASDTPAQITVQPGGAAANTAAWLAHLGQSVHLIGALGEDSLAAIFRRSMAHSGVNLHAAQIPGAATGTCIVIVDQTGERTMFPDPGANAALAITQQVDSLFTEGAHLHLSGYTLLNPATRTVGRAALTLARERHLTCSLDLASAAPIRADRSASWEVLDQLDVLFANSEEAAALTGLADSTLALAALADVVETVIIKCGPLGALAAQGPIRCQVPALGATVVDTTGAGDAFAAGFLPAWRAGLPLIEAVSAGVREATHALCRVGAGPNTP